MKRVLDVGNCSADHASIRQTMEAHFDVDVQRAHGLDETLDQLRGATFDLVTINREMDRDGSSGLEIIKAIKSDAQLASTPVMLISNYPEYQQKAVELGAAEGFGKRQLRDDSTRELLSRYLEGGRMKAEG